MTAVEPPGPAVPVDAAVPVNAAVPVDAGEPVSTAEPVTAVAPMDAGEPPTPTGRPTPSLLQATRTMAVATAVSRLTGFLRTAVLVPAIGIGLVGDAYNTANVLPNIVYELLLGGVLTSVIVPLLVHARERDSDDGIAYTQRLLSLLTVFLVLATALAVLAAPLLTYAYGIRGNPEQVALATLLARILLVEIVFYGVGAMLTAILNSRQVFGPPAWAPVLNNVVVIATGLLFIALGDGRMLTPDNIPDGLVWLLGVGTTLGIVVQAAALLPAMRRAGVPLGWRWDWRGSGLGEAARLSGWVVGYVAISIPGFLVISMLANEAGRESGIGSAVYAHASLLFQLPYGILGVALLTAMVPRMSQAAARKDVPALVRDFSLGARLTAVALLPMSALLMALGPAIAVVAFARGQVGPDKASMIGVVLAASAFGLFPYALTLLQLRIFYAMKDARTPTLINLAMVAVRIPLCLLVPAIVPAELVVTGLAVANSLSFLVGAVVGELCLRSRLGRVETVRVLRTCGLVAVVSVLAGATAWLVGGAVESLLPRGALGSLAAVAAGSLSGGGVLLAGFLVLPIAEVREVAGNVRRRLGGPAQAQSRPTPETTAATERRDGVQPGSPADGPQRPPDTGTGDIGGQVTVGGRYRLLARSGADDDTGAGRLSTWRARDTLLERDVMLRIHAPGGDAARQFLDRALAAGVLSHPALAMVYDAVDEGRRAYVVSEWVDGDSLADRLAGGPLTEADARETIRRVAEGVAQAHQLGLFVGGLVPERVILTRTGSVTVVAIPAPAATREGDLRALGGLLFATMAGFLPVTDDPAELDHQLTNATAPDLADVALAVLEGRLNDAGDVVRQLVAGRRPLPNGDSGGLAFITDRYEYDAPPVEGWPTISGPRAVGPAGAGPGGGGRAGGPAAGGSGADRPGGATPPRRVGSDTVPVSRQGTQSATDAAGTTGGRRGSEGSSAAQELASMGRSRKVPSALLAARTMLRRRIGVGPAGAAAAGSATGASPVAGTGSAPGTGTAVGAGPAIGAAGPAAGSGGSGAAIGSAAGGLRSASTGPDRDPVVDTAETAVIPLSADGPPPPSSQAQPGPGVGHDAAAGDAIDDEAAEGDAIGDDADDDPWAGTGLFDDDDAADEDEVGDDSGDSALAAGDRVHHGATAVPAGGPEVHRAAGGSTGGGIHDGGASDDDASDDDAGPEKRRRTWLVLAFPVAALLAVALIGWVIGSALPSTPDTSEPPTSQSTAESTTSAAESTTPPPAEPAALPVLTATVFDPFGDGASENGVEAPLAADGDPATSWPTLTYRGSPALGGLKPGVGLVFDLGAPAVVTEVTIATDQPGATVELRAGTAPTADSLDPFPVRGQQELTASSTIAVDGDKPARYWLVWITGLVPDDGSFSASLGEVTFTGVPAG